MRIKDANELLLRPTFETLIRIDAGANPLQAINTTGAYRSGTINEFLPVPTFMDLSGGGFLNDGQAVPVGDNFILSRIGVPMTITGAQTITIDSTYQMTVTGYEGGKPRKWLGEKTGQFNWRLQLPASDERIIITDIRDRNFWRFDKHNTVSLSGVLRSVETKQDNPELQLSELELVGYEKNAGDAVEAISEVGLDKPIYYTTGYVDDMAPVRTFYLSEPIEVQDDLLTFRAQDASKFLDGQYSEYVGSYGTNGGLNKYVKALHDMLTANKITHEYTNGLTEDEFEQGDAFFIDGSPRQILAQAVNIFRTDLGKHDESLPVFINYVDAGIPKLTTGQSHTVQDLKFISKPEIITDPMISGIQMNNYQVKAGTSQTIDTVQGFGIIVNETSEPYYSFTTSAGTITKLSAYSYRLSLTGGSTEATVSGRPLMTGAPDDFTNPIVVSKGIGALILNSRFATLDDLVGLLNTVSDERGDEPRIRQALLTILDRSNVMYKFTYRGDPTLQPRDYIRADVDGDGTLTDMTIDTIEFTHEGGGYKQIITARKGLI